MNWSTSWSKVCDSDRIVPSPSRSASGPWCWVGRSVMFLFDCWLAGWHIISNPWCGSSVDIRLDHETTKFVACKRHVPEGVCSVGLLGPTLSMAGLRSMAGLSPVNFLVTFPANFQADRFAPNFKFSLLCGLGLVPSVFQLLF
ncbi:hypothetical protein YC2023_072183 [Brassica napus]